MSFWNGCIAVLVVAAALLGLVQLWYPVLSTAVFIKALVSIAVLCAVAGVIGVMRHEDRQKRRGYIE